MAVLIFPGILYSLLAAHDESEGVQVLTEARPSSQSNHRRVAGSRATLVEIFYSMRSTTSRLTRVSQEVFATCQR